ncbi:50S ribosomal protein L11 methyltransferase [Domibacillus sp. DTU_2020_1001157_1_SI_ALB_TIR_016]|uniref:50S ribosomal protein L11 methyltransferase n=1 Tax=Domibacillus sp. DTU_2020_1001157_1_SI_ALB_TIR_016 TaxID=3077789 RepID=UPI0028EB46D2|nr:50S ribosomal protein L11 methyltransferase [Domibacillus sp. DTU_2020_1001157_1_SI_ALB_TIR_016]WNS81912.1 50S ribosomal protein L11 methyltransferase [Domibacillus sp. DTU_2020_1001157_1_SI_ALB_TIR_016]
MKWSEICIETVNDAVEPISNILHEAGASGVVIEDRAELDKKREGGLFGELYELNPNDYPDEGVAVKAYLPVNSFLQETVDDITAAVKNLSAYQIDTGKLRVSVSEVHEEDWATAWKQYYNPVKISEKFTIVPTWEEYEPFSTDELIIELDPGMAFGTGTHPTTVMCLQALERFVKPDHHVVDVGTGSGVLAIGAALLGASRVTALDLDEVAVSAARQNVALNHAEHIVTVSKNNLIDGIDDQPDVVVSNILAEVIISFTDDVASILRPGGFFIASGIIGQKKDEVRKAMTDAGLFIEETVVMEDWVCIVGKKAE